jgi:hypothetical protein
MCANTTGAFNVALGRFALNKNTTACGNVGVGNAALYQNITGTNNVAVGNSALRDNTSGNNNTGQLGSTSGVDASDPTWTNGKVGKGLSFDGVDDYIVTNSIMNGNVGDYSISAWVKLNIAYSPGFPQHYILSNAVLSNGIYLNTDGDENQFGCNSTFSTNSIGMWHHYLGVKAGNSFTLFIDNINVGSTSNCSSNIVNGNPIFFGNSSINTEFTNGIIDDIGIWNRA